MNLMWLPIVVGVAFALLVSWPVVRNLAILRAQLAAYRRGDYEAQLKIVEALRSNGSEPTYYLFFHGSACLKLGRLEEAEQALRRSLEKEADPARRTICRDELGRVYMEQGRWDEAAECFQQCIVEARQRGGGHRAMAEMLLRQGKQNEAALQAARLAVAADRAEKAPRGRLGKEAHDLNVGESLAFLAWALAANRAAPAEVDSTLNEAFALCGETNKPILGELHFCAGHAYALLGNTAASASHFHRAAEIDPAGNYGRLSRSAATTLHQPA